MRVVNFGIDLMRQVVIPYRQVKEGNPTRLWDETGKENKMHKMSGWMVGAFAAFMTVGASADESAFATELANEALLEAIKKGDFYSTEGPALHVERKENKLIIDTSPCEIIGTISNLSWDRDRVLRGENLTHFEYEIRQNEKWIRVEARDKNGKKSWSNIFAL